MRFANCCWVTKMDYPLLINCLICAALIYYSYLIGGCIKKTLDELKRKNKHDTV